MRVIPYVLAVAASIVPAAAQEAGPEPVIEASPEPALVYEPFGAAPPLTELVVTIEGPPQSVLRVTPATVGVLAFEGQGTAIPYALSSPDAPPSAGGAVLEILVPDGDDEAAAGRAEVAVQLLPVPNLTPPPGDYEALIDLALLGPGGDVLTQLIEVPVLLTVPARADVVFAGTTGAFDPSRSVAFIDFGELETGERRDLFVTVRANADTLITLASENGGVLKHEEKPELPSIGYTVTLDGEASSLAAPLLLTRPTPSGPGGTAYPLAIIIGRVEGAFAGPYRDLITVDVTPQ